MTSTIRAGLALDDLGRDDGRPPLVLLHGLTFDRRTWSPVVAAVRAADPNRRILAIDLPGHGDSPPRPDHGLPAVADAVHAALAESGVGDPVLVGHSLSGSLASVYASERPVAGVVNVDQPPYLGEFARLLRSIEPQLRGDGFPAAWRIFADSFGTELLAPAERRLVEQTCHPDQALIVSYWRELLERPVEDLLAWVEACIARLAERGVPYVLVAGHRLSPADAALLAKVGPRARVEVWPGYGHFPHLGYPDRFAALLGQTAAWREAARAG